MNAKVISRTNLGCQVVRTEDETGEHVRLSMPRKGAMTWPREEEPARDRDAEEFFLAEQCPADSNFR